MIDQIKQLEDIYFEEHLAKFAKDKKVPFTEEELVLIREKFDEMLEERKAGMNRKERRSYMKGMAKYY